MVITEWIINIVVIRLMLPGSLCLKLITLSGFHCHLKFGLLPKEGLKSEFRHKTNSCLHPFFFYFTIWEKTYSEKKDLDNVLRKIFYV